MNKILTYVLMLVLASSLVLAQGQGIHEPGTGIENPELREAAQGTGQEQGSGEGEQVTVMTRTRAQTSTELRQIMQQKQQVMNQETEGVGSKVRSVYQNQNRVRLAVYSLLAMEDLAGGLGRNISAIARTFNNSVQATIRAEEKIQTRSAFVRFFAGGDAESAEKLEQESARNQERIQQLKQLREQCDCNAEVKAVMQEQIQNMEQEQARLQQLAQEEQKSKGLFGWIWK